MTIIDRHTGPTSTTMIEDLISYNIYNLLLYNLFLTIFIIFRVILYSLIHTKKKATTILVRLTYK